MTQGKPRCASLSRRANARETAVGRAVWADDRGRPVGRPFIGRASPRDRPAITISVRWRRLGPAARSACGEVHRVRDGAALARGGTCWGTRFGPGRPRPDERKARLRVGERDGDP